VKETKRQGRIAHHHSDATVPHIVALPGFSFHAAKISNIPLSSKQISIYFIFFLQRTNRRTQGMTNDYDDIINLPHYEPKHHPRMSMWNRAAQFAPFAALTGYDAAIQS
jgi:hypothetical protein